MSQENDYYYEMLLLSHYSLRLYHPKGDTEVVLVMDTDTHQRLVDKKTAILDDVTSVVVDIPAEYTIMQRSRYLKTSLRQRVEGDFLYLDCDTIIYNSLNGVDSFDVDIAMVSDENDELCYRNSLSIEYCIKAGFLQLEGKPYYNSGVIYAKNNQTTKLFYNTWHCLWNESVKKGVPQDQPSLCQTNVNHGYPIIELPYIWNGMKVGKISINDIKIRHYFSGINTLCYSQILVYIRKTGHVNGLDNLLRHPYTICESALNISDERFIRYIYTEQFHIYESSYNRYQRLSFLFTFLSKIYLFVSKIKRI